MKRNKAARFMKFEDLSIGSRFTIEKTFTHNDVQTFADILGDHNLLHLDEAYARNHSPFQKPIIHGMLVSSCFSTLVGMQCPGKDGIYISQTLAFKLPVYVGETILAIATVIQKNESIRIAVLKTEILKNKIEVAIIGEAKVKFF